MAPDWVQEFPVVSRPAICPAAIDMVFVMARFGTPAEIVALEETAIFPVPKEALFPATTLPPLRVVPPL
jgi:hypothetical protein